MIYRIDIPDLSKSIEAGKGGNLKSVLENAGIRFPLHCGGKGKCGSCVITVLKGEIEQFSREKEIFGEHSQNRLACLHKVGSDLSLEIPRLSDISAGKIISDFIFDSMRTGFSVAFDLGTTTIAGYLVNLSQGKIIDYLNVLNPQSALGADVMTRLESAKTEEGLAELHGLIEKKIRYMVNDLAQRNNILSADISGIYIAGNTAMTHFLLGRMGEGLERAPYKSPFEGKGFLDFQTTDADGIYKHRGRMLPILSSFIGGDTVAAIIASDLDKANGKRLLIDFGTNGEIVLSAEGNLYMTSTAAGPAFEGVGMSCGMPALNGAVEGFQADGTANVIGDTKEIKGICGSGYISGISYLLQSGKMKSSGLLDRDQSGVRRWLVAQTEERDIFIDQSDIRKFQLAKGAISAGIEILCSEAGIDISGMDEIVLTGSFGNRIDRTSAINTGLIPDINLDRIIFMDNAAGRGAVLCSVSDEYIYRADRISSISQFINLGEHTDFQEVYVSNMVFP